MKKALSLVCLFVLSVSAVYAASPDGVGPWADSVVSSSQALTKDGQPVSTVSPARSNPQAAIGVAEGDYDDAHFFSLGFGGSITLQFDNGVRDGVLVVETTNVDPVYPIEQASVDVSSDGTSWTSAGTVNQDGQVTMPESVLCVHYVRVTDVSNPDTFVEGSADGYDVDGVQAINSEACESDNEQEDPTPTPTGQASPTPTPTQTPQNGGNTPQGNNNPAVCTASKPQTPSITSLVRTSATSVQLQWTAVSGVTHYAISYGTSPGNYQYGVANTGNTTSFTIGGLDPNARYYFSVRAINDCTPGEASGEAGTVSGGSVLGASTSGGQVLGTSTDVLAATGSWPQTARMLVSLGAGFVAGIMAYAIKRTTNT